MLSLIPSTKSTLLLQLKQWHGRFWLTEFGTGTHRKNWAFKGGWEFNGKGVFEHLRPVEHSQVTDLPDSLLSLEILFTWKGSSLGVTVWTFWRDGYSARWLRSYHWPDCWVWGLILPVRGFAFSCLSLSSQVCGWQQWDSPPVSNGDLLQTASIAWELLIGTLGPDSICPSENHHDTNHT